MPILGNDVFRVDMRPLPCCSMLGICRFVPLYVILEYDAERLSLGVQYVVNHGRICTASAFPTQVIRLVERLEREVRRIRRAVFSTLNAQECSRGVCWSCFM